MRPIPAKRHHWAVIGLTAVVAANTALVFRQVNITDDQANMLAEVFKRNDPGLYAADEVFGPTGPAAPWRAREPGWRALLGGAAWLGGAADPLNAFRILSAASLLVYLLGAYALLYRQTRSTSTAALVAAMSMAIFSVRRPYWGAGPIFAVTPATLYLAAVPLLVMGFLRLRRRWSVLAVFFLAGLCGNIHLHSAVNLVLVLALALVASERFRPRAWALGALSVVAAAIGAAPAIYHCQAALRAGGALTTEMTISQFRGILELAGLNVLYPQVLIQGLRWLPVAAALAAPAAIVLARAGRYRVRDLRAWLWMLAGAVAVAFGLQGLSQAVGWRLGILPPVIEFFDALRLAMLPLYALFAQAMVHLLRLARRNRNWVRVALGALAAVYLGSSFNTRPVRHIVRDAVAAVAEEEHARDEGPDAQAELRAIARWAGRNRHTPPEAVFICGKPEIRLYARRSVLFCPADVRYLYRLAPQRLDRWAQEIRVQRKLLNPPEGTPADADRIVALVDTYWQRRSAPSAPTYVLIPTRAAPGAALRLREIAPPGAIWGDHWRVYRVLPLSAAASPD